MGGGKEVPTEKNRSAEPRRKIPSPNNSFLSLLSGAQVLCGDFRRDIMPANRSNSAMRISCFQHSIQFGTLLTILLAAHRTAISAENLTYNDLFKAAEVTDVEQNARLMYLEFEKLKHLAVDCHFNTEFGGFDEQEWTGYVKLKVRTLLPDFSIQSLTPDEVNKPDFEASRWGDLSVSITTVGTKYPVAYSVEVRLAHLGSPGLHHCESTLGFASEEVLRTTRTLKDAVADLIEKIAIRFDKGREANEKVEAVRKRLLEGKEEKDVKKASPTKKE